MAAPIVFLDLAGPDEAALRAFYRDVFDWPADGQATFTPGNAPNLDATIRQDPAEMRLYLGVRDVTAALEKVVAAGGSIDQPRFEVPGQVVIGLFRDLAGNPMGLIEMNGDEVVVP